MKILSQNMSVKRLITILMFIVFYLSQTSCCQREKPGNLYGGTITIGQITSPKTLNPVLEFSGVSSQIVDIIFDGLIDIGRKGEILPGLAISWEEKNSGQEWVFSIRKGVKFHDGHPLTADDVEFTLNLARDPSTGSGYANFFQQISKINVRDLYTIDIHLVRPSVSFIYGLTLGILPRHLLQEGDIAHFNYHPIGTGPYRFIQWSSDKVELGANQHYFMGRPYLDRVVIRSFENQRIVWANLMKGEIDAFQLLDSGSYEIIKSISCFRGYSALKPYYYFIGFNLANPLFQDRKVRQALNYAVDKNSIVQKVLKGRGVVSSGTIFPDSWAFNSRIEPFPYNPQKALKLLAEAGWQDTDGDHILDKNNQPFEFQFYFVEGDDEIETASLMVMEQLSNIGVVVKVNKSPLEIFNREYLLPKKFEAAFMYIAAGSDPDTNYLFWHSSQIKTGFNIFSYHNPVIDQLLDQGRCTSDQGQRKKIYAQYQEQMKEDPPGIFIFWKENLLGVHKRFHGVDLSPFCGVLNNIREWYVPADEQQIAGKF